MRNRYKDGSFDVCSVEPLLISNHLPLTDRGFRYGMALFETLRCVRGVAQFLPEHIERLTESARLAGFPEITLNEETFARTLQEQELNGVARIYLTAGDGAPDAPITEPRIAVLTETKSLAAPQTCALTIHPDPHLPPFNGLKTANYWLNADALTRSNAQGFDNALLFHPAGHLIGAATANVFLKIDGKWQTPSPDASARQGIVRAWTLRHLEAWEVFISKPELELADAAFLTNSWLGVLPVTRIDSRTLSIPPEVPPLRDAFFKHVGEAS